MSCENCGNAGTSARNCAACMEVFYAEAIAHEAALVAQYAEEDAAWERELAGRAQDAQEAAEFYADLTARVYAAGGVEALYELESST